MVSIDTRGRAYLTFAHASCVFGVSQALMPYSDGSNRRRLILIASKTCFPRNRPRRAAIRRNEESTVENVEHVIPGCLVCCGPASGLAGGGGT